VRRQLVRSAGSVASNYRAATRARSRKEFIAKISIAIEECDETDFWMEFGKDLDMLKSGVEPLRNESSQLTAIFVASRCTARKRMELSQKIKTSK
jgi:four helix bundle protein